MLLVHICVCIFTSYLYTYTHRFIDTWWHTATKQFPTEGIWILKCHFCSLLHLNGFVHLEKCRIPAISWLFFSFAFFSSVLFQTYLYIQTLFLLQKWLLCIMNTELLYMYVVHYEFLHFFSFFFSCCVNNFSFCRGFHSNNIKSIPERAFVGNPSLITM